VREDAVAKPAHLPVATVIGGLAELIVADDTSDNWPYWA
jgi:hypothetical protein